MESSAGVGVQELQAQAYAFSAKLRQCEDEKGQQMVAVKMEHAAILASTEERYREELSQVSTDSILEGFRGFYLENSW